MDDINNPFYLDVVQRPRVTPEWENKYCGPAALSRVAGIPVAEATRRLREVSRLPRIRRVAAAYLEMCLREDPGVIEKHSFLRRRGPSIEAWVKTQDLSVYWVLRIAGHYTVVRNGKVFDVGDRIYKIKDYPRRTSKVIDAWKCRLEKVSE